MARPTAASAAATTITKKTSTCPSRVPAARLKATKARLTPFSISSMHMRTVMTLRRRKTPRVPEPEEDQAQQDRVLDEAGVLHA